MAKCLVSGGSNGLNIKTGVLTFNNENDKGIDLGGTPQMVAVTNLGFNVSAVNICLKQSNKSVLILAPSGTNIGEIISTNNGIRVRLNSHNTLNIYFFAIM